MSVAKKAEEATVKREAEKRAAVGLPADDAAPVPAKAAPPVAGQKRGNPKDGLVYVWIPPGTFTMGCSRDDSECEDNEKPPHEVTITHGFWMGQTPVTVGAWKRYSQATSRPMPPDRIEAWTLNAALGNDSLPVVGVTWDQAVGYCGWAAKRLGREAVADRSGVGISGAGGDNRCALRESG